MEQEEESTEAGPKTDKSSDGLGEWGKATKSSGTQPAAKTLDPRA